MKAMVVIDLEAKVAGWSSSTGGEWRAGGLADDGGGKEGSIQLASLLASRVLVEPSFAGPTKQGA
jgi:hypothetical protein